ncbi:hypothetical protein [Nocardia yunnanensis]|uniref:hypothetical protein n=1 Tax=Nocardia yunnanensis TaxID=2382165 RepID=UPI0013C46D25|nr:hypothetical protein [Nocardia yunnanensis]
MTRLGFRALTMLPAFALCAMTLGCTDSAHTTPATTERFAPPVGSLDTLGTTSPAVTTVAPPTAAPTTAAPAPAAQPGLSEDDARYTVRRYLARWVGQPLQPDDTEGKYPLVCGGSVLAANPGRLTGTIAFDNDHMTARRTGDTGAEVTVPVTNSANVTTVMTFALRAAAQGYCLADVLS